MDSPASKWRRVLAAGMLGAAVFLVQAGTVELVLRNDRICQQARVANWAVNPKGCQPEIVKFLLQGLSYGAVGLMRPDLPAVGVMTMAVLMGLLAASLAFLPLRHSIPAFLLVEMMAAFVFGAVGFLMLFIG